MLLAIRLPWVSTTSWSPFVLSHFGYFQNLTLSSGLGDLYKPLLNKLCGPRHGIGVYLYSGNEVTIAPAVSPCCSSTELDLHTSVHQITNKFLVWVASRNIAVGVIRLVMQRHVTSIGMKDHYNLELRLPTGDIVHYELKVKERCWQVAFERKRCDTEHHLDLSQFDRDIDVQRFVLNSHMSFLGSMEIDERAIPHTP